MSGGDIAALVERCLRCGRPCSEHGWDTRDECNMFVGKGANDDLPTALTDLQARLEAAEAENAKLRAERQFLLVRAGHAGTCSFAPGRWTGMSSNALVAVAFGYEDDCLPSDAGDLAACYRTVMRMPAHMRTEAVWAQLERGEAHVRGKYPQYFQSARDASEWPDNPRATLGGEHG